MFQIERDSEAFRTLERMVNDPLTRYIRVSVKQPNPNPEAGPAAICLSQNQEMWTYPLRVEEVKR